MKPTKEFRIGQFLPRSAAARCLAPLLDAMGWNGDSHRLAESFPQDAGDLSIDQLQNTLAILGYESANTETNLRHLDARLFPCLFHHSQEEVFVLVKESGDGSILAYDGATGQYRQIPRDSRKGTALLVRVSRNTASLQNPAKGWFTTLFLRFRPLLVSALAVSLILSLLSLVSPVFVQTVYNLVLGTPDTRTLVLLGLGIFLYIGIDAGFRQVRAHMQTYLSARLGNIVGNEVLRRLLYLPSQYTESAPLGGQLARIRDFESVREFFGGPATAALLDLPFTLVLIVGMAFISGPLVVVPLVALVLLVLFGLAMAPLVRRANVDGALIAAKKQELVLELLTGLRGIKYAGLSKVWTTRFESASADVAVNSYKSAQLLAIIDATSSTVVSLAGLIVMVWGVLRVESGSLTAGALMSSMMLVWRVMAPLRSGFAVLTQVNRVFKSVGQLNRLMEMPIEVGSHTSELVRPLKGEISFSQVSMRYSPDLAPALVSLSMDIPAGSLCAICGHGGSGKTTLLKLILGLYQPLAGRISIDNFNVRQLDPVALRRGISYLPQYDRLFTGTIASNVALADPTATVEEITQALTDSGIMSVVSNLPAGIDTSLTGAGALSLPASITRGISLARFHLRRMPIMLIDSPETGLASHQLSSLLETIRNRGSGRTVVVVTNDRNILSAADQILWIDQGRLRACGAPGKILSSYFGDSKP